MVNITDDRSICTIYFVDKDLACGEEVTNAGTRDETDITCGYAIHFYGLRRVVTSKRVNLSFAPVNAIDTGRDLHLRHGAVSSIITRIVLDLIQLVSHTIIYGQSFTNISAAGMESAVSDLECMVKCQIRGTVAVDAAFPINIGRIRSVAERIIICHQRDRFRPVRIMTICAYRTYTISVLRREHQIILRVSRCFDVVEYSAIDFDVISIDSINSVPSYRDIIIRLVDLTQICRYGQSLIQFICWQRLLIGKAFDNDLEIILTDVGLRARLDIQLRRRSRIKIRDR